MDVVYNNDEFSILVFASRYQRTIRLFMKIFMYFNKLEYAALLTQTSSAARLSNFHVFTAFIV